LKDPGLNEQPAIEKGQINIATDVHLGSDGIRFRVDKNGKIRITFFVEVSPCT